MRLGYVTPKLEERQRSRENPNSTVKEGREKAERKNKRRQRLG